MTPPTTDLRAQLQGKASLLAQMAEICDICDGWTEMSAAVLREIEALLRSAAASLTPAPPTQEKGKPEPDSREWWRDVAQKLAFDYSRVDRALTAAWQDIHDWLQLARRQRRELTDVDRLPCGPTDAGIAASERVLEQIREASQRTAGETPAPQDEPCRACADGECPLHLGSPSHLGEVVKVVPPFQHPGYIVRRAKPRPIQCDEDEPAAPQDWQPIATAPKDGTAVLLSEPGELLGYEIPHYTAGYWAPSHRCAAGGFWQDAYRDMVVQPTHWQPLPTSPTASASSSDARPTDSKKPQSAE